MSREENRHHRDRMLQRGRKVHSMTMNMGQANNDDMRWLDRVAYQFVKTKAACSCYMCGNPRRHLKGEEKLTVAELQAAVTMREAIEDIFNVKEES
jgi:hypothetical protein